MIDMADFTGLPDTPDTSLASPDMSAADPDASAARNTDNGNRYVFSSLQS